MGFARPATVTMELNRLHRRRSICWPVASQQSSGRRHRDMDFLVACAPCNDGGVSTGETYGVAFLPNFACNCGDNRSGLNGTAVNRMPVASASALPSAAATGL